MTAATSFPVKKILSKLKVCNVANYCSEDKRELKAAILEKNVEVKECMENNDANNNQSSHFTVIKVSPCLGDFILKTHWLLIIMESRYVADHYHIV